ncbi:unnamed protein product [Lathyrus oleraceus]
MEKIEGKRTYRIRRRFELMETDVILRSCDAGFPSVMKSEAGSDSADAVRDAYACSYPLRKLHVGRLKLQSVSLQFILQGDGEGIRRS